MSRTFKEVLHEGLPYRRKGAEAGEGRRTFRGRDHGRQARQLAGNADYVSSGREGSPLVRTQNVGKPGTLVRSSVPHAF